MIDKYKDDILILIKQHGPLGVNSLSKSLNIPLSTLQKYMHRQSYFKINEDRKWDLPENVISDIKSNTLSLMTNVVENNLLLLKAQMEEMALLLDNSLVPISTLKRGIDNITTPVADSSDKTTKIDQRLLDIDDVSHKIYTVIKRQKDNIPDIYKNLLNNFDYVGMVLSLGEKLATDMIADEIYTLLTGKNTTLSEEMVETLKEYQK